MVVSCRRWRCRRRLWRCRCRRQRRCRRLFVDAVVVGVVRRRRCAARRRRRRTWQSLAELKSCFIFYIVYGLRPKTKELLELLLMLLFLLFTFWFISSFKWNKMKKYLAEAGIKPLISCSSDHHSIHWAVVAWIHCLQKILNSPWTCIGWLSCFLWKCLFCLCSSKLLAKEKNLLR